MKKDNSTKKCRKSNPTHSNIMRRLENLQKKNEEILSDILEKSPETVEAKA